MMLNIKNLLKIQFLQLPIISDLKATDKKRKILSVLTCIGMIILGIFILIQMLGLVFVLQQAGLANLIPVYIITIASFILIILVLFSAKSILFSSSDWQLLVPLPLPTWLIILSKTLFIYILNLGLTLLISIPSLIFWIYFEQISLLAIIFIILLCFFIPLIPIAIGGTITLLITQIAQRFKNSAIVNGLLTLLVIGGLFLIFSNVSSLDSQLSNEVLVQMILKLSNYYIPSMLVNPQFIKNIYFGALLFILLSSILFTLFIYFTSKNYQHINTYLNQNMILKRKSLKTQKRSPLTALIIKELNHFFHLPTAMINIGLGLGMILVLSIFLFFTDVSQIIDKFGDSLTQLHLNSQIIYSLFPFLILLILSISNYASAILSLEGKNLWITQTLPISFKTVILSKILTNMILQGVPLLIFSIALIAKHVLPAFQLFPSLILVFSFSLFISILGLLMNFLFPNFNWNNEVQVIKQGLPLLISMGFCTILSFTFIGVAFVFFNYINILLWVVSLFLLFGSFILFKQLKKKTLLF